MPALSYEVAGEQSDGGGPSWSATVSNWKVMASRVFLLFLLMQIPLAAAEIPISSGFPPFLNGLPFQSVSGPEDGEATGTLLEMLSGVTSTGKGVIVGIIDTGIDWRHPDFRDPADSLRSPILAIWDMNSELGSTVIAYRLPHPGTVKLTLYDLLGRPVRRLVSEYQEAGSHEITWDGADDRGRAVASGVYLYRLKTGNQQLSRRLVFVR